MPGYPSQFDASINLLLPTRPVGIDDPVLYGEFNTLYGALQTLVIGIDAIDRCAPIFDFTATQGQLVNLINTAGVTHAKLATAAAAGTAPALGFASSGDGVTSGNNGDVQAKGKIIGLTGLTPGAIYYLSDTVAGSYQTAKPVGAGKIVQPIGFAMDATVLYFNPTLLYITL